MQDHVCLLLIYKIISKRLKPLIQISNVSLFQEAVWLFKIQGLSRKKGQQRKAGS